MPDNEAPPEYTEKELLPSTDLPIVNTDNDLKALVGDMPKVVPDAIAAAENKENQAETIQKAAFDRKGRPFDPLTHLADDAGNPLMTPGGAFRKKMRLPGQQKAGMILPEPTVAPVDQKIKLAAGKLADVFIITGISFFGDEWKPKQEKDFNERQMLVDANERWMIEHGYVEPPAWIDLALAYGLYTGSRFIQRKPEGRIEKIVQWGRTKLTNLWLKITGQKIKIVPTDK